MSIKDEILEYLSRCGESNLCFPKLFVYQEHLYEKDNSEEIVNLLFQNYGQQEGLQIWLINHKNNTPIYLKKNPDTIDLLSIQNNYIFLKTYTTIVPHKAKYSYEIFYWIGDATNNKNNFTVCYYSTLLSSCLEKCPLFREEYGVESEPFQQLFRFNCIY